MKTVTARDLQKNFREWVDGLRQHQTLVSHQGKPAAVSGANEESDRRELMSIVNSRAMVRDLRLDFFRGLALFCIFIDHIPNNILAKFTLQSLMFAD
ncbi:MAG TPA: OpgC domain-containing protein, partial [Candidatus Binatia bacterium]|nr:OpgC domain-containing protein [Candidatus Binatia bacterium]